MAKYVLEGESFFPADRGGPMKDTWEPIEPFEFSAMDDEDARRKVDAFIAERGKLRNTKLLNVRHVTYSQKRKKT